MMSLSLLAGRTVVDTTRTRKHTFLVIFVYKKENVVSLNSAFWVILCALSAFFFNVFFFPKISFSNHICMPNSLDPESNNLDQDQARNFFWPYLGQNCLQRLSADGKVTIIR